MPNRRPYNTHFQFQARRKSIERWAVIAAAEGFPSLSSWVRHVCHQAERNFRRRWRRDKEELAPPLPTERDLVELLAKLRSAPGHEERR